MRVVLGGDSAGRPLVETIAKHLREKAEHEIADFSEPETAKDEFYAELAERVGNEILRGNYDRGILVCGTGIGVSISANKIPGIRAALTHDTYSAERAALSNNAQIITMGARVIGPEHAKRVVDTFLAQTFDHQSRSALNVEAIDKLDLKYRCGGSRS